MKHIKTLTSERHTAVVIGASLDCVRASSVLTHLNCDVIASPHPDAALVAMRELMITGQDPVAVICDGDESPESRRFIELLRGTTHFADVTVIVVKDLASSNLLEEYSRGVDYFLPENFTEAQLRYAVETLNGAQAVSNAS